MKFKYWLINEGSYANFGFNKKTVEKKEIVEENPIKKFNIEHATNLLSQQKVGNKLAKQEHLNIVQWGNGVGAIRVQFGTKLHIVVERLSSDLLGNPTWITKKSYNVNHERFAGNENIVVNDLLSELTRFDSSEYESPKSNFNDLETVVRLVAEKSKQVVNEQLFLNDIKKISDSEFVIKYIVRGQGVQAPDQRRVEQVQLQFKYDSNKGLIQVIEGNVESTLGERKFMLVPSDYILHFSPVQPMSEIVDSLSTIMKYF